MPQAKYVVVSIADIRNYLTEDQKNQFVQIMGAIETGRRKAALPAAEIYFTMNMRDKFSHPAIEAYIAAIQNDGSVVGNAGVQQALETAQAARQQGIMAGTPRLPSLPL